MDMIIEKETRIIDLTVEQLSKVIAESFANSPAPEPQEDVPLNVEQACQFLGQMPKPTLYFKCNKGDMPHIKQGGRLYFFKKDLIHWLRNYTVVSAESKAADFLSNFKTNFSAKK
jgi:Helix-turn-helix domain